MQRYYNYVCVHPKKLPNYYFLSTCRTVNLSVLASSWMTSLLCILGFLPQGKLLYLPPDHLDLLLLSCALSIISGVELAVTRGAIHVER